jgi:hypothetical protein
MKCFVFFDQIHGVPGDNGGTIRTAVREMGGNGSETGCEQHEMSGGQMDRIFCGKVTVFQQSIDE